MTGRTVSGGLFITFEGPEGSGKSSHIERLSAVLTGRGYDVKVTREPGGTALGEQLRELLKHFHDPEGVSPEAELLMFGASRAQHMHCVIRPHLLKGGIVLCDRFADSTTVYQGQARGLDPDFIARMHRFTIGSRWPDLTLLLDIDIDEGFTRTRTRGRGRTDRIEAESRRFHETVRQGFLDLARAEPRRIKVISTSADPETVHLRIMEMVDGAFA